MVSQPIGKRSSIAHSYKGKLNAFIHWALVSFIVVACGFLIDIAIQAPSSLLFSGPALLAFAGILWDIVDEYQHDT